MEPRPGASRRRAVPDARRAAGIWPASSRFGGQREQFRGQLDGRGAAGVAESRSRGSSCRESQLREPDGGDRGAFGDINRGGSGASRDFNRGSQSGATAAGAAAAERFGGGGERFGEEDGDERHDVPARSSSRWRSSLASQAAWPAVRSPSMQAKLQGFRPPMRPRVPLPTRSARATRKLWALCWARSGTEFVPTTSRAA